MRLGMAMGVVAVCAAIGAISGACTSFSEDDSALPGSEAGTETGVSGDAAADGPSTGPFCSRHPGAVFCEDFDDPGRAIFDGTSAADGSVIAVQDGGFSPPSAVRFSLDLPRLVTETCPTLQKERGGLDVAIAKGFHAELQVAPGGIGGAALPGNVAFGFEVVVASSDGKECSYYLDADGTDAQFVQDDRKASTVLPLGRALVAGKWNKVSVDVTGPPGGQMLSLAVDGTPGTTAAVRPECQDKVRITRVNLGLYCVDVSTPRDVEIWFDDVLLTTP